MLEWSIRTYLVVAGAFIGAVGGCAATILFFQAAPDAQRSDVGDMLGFLGAIVGTLLAIGGAVYIEHLKRFSENRQQKIVILQVLDHAASRIRFHSNEVYYEGMNVKPKISLVSDLFKALDLYFDGIVAKSTNFDVIRYSVWMKNEAKSNHEKLEDAMSFCDKHPENCHKILSYGCAAALVPLDMIRSAIEASPRL